MPARIKLPQRRKAETTEIAIGNMTLTATVGVDNAGRAARPWPPSSTTRAW
jgi:hypothetical protein